MYIQIYAPLEILIYFQFMYIYDYKWHVISLMCMFQIYICCKDAAFYMQDLASTNVIASTRARQTAGNMKDGCMEKGPSLVLKNFTKFFSFPVSYNL